MTLLDTTSSAQILARSNFVANIQALIKTQPAIRPWVMEQHLSAEWVYGRDGTLTALDEFGQWPAGCSLPQRAARTTLAKLDVKGAVACFLWPSHAAQLGVAMEMMRPEQALVAIVPELRDLATILHCRDFSDQIGSHRLWFAGGPGWEVGLRNLFDDHPGLATPSQFIRTPDADAEQIERLIPLAQQVFSQVTTGRNTEIQSLRESITHSGGKPKVCILAPSRFRLWNDIGQAMLAIFDDQNDFEVVRFNPDDPMCSSPLALLKASRDCTAIFTANTARSDLPGMLPETVPWITWATTNRIPSSALAGVDDHLILSDPSLRETAIRNGWTDSRVHVGGWPSGVSSAPCVQTRQLAMIVDTNRLDTPKDLIEYSSHSLLWESIRHEVSHEPMLVTDPAEFLNERMRRLGISDDTLQRGRFIEKLILPAYQQGLARILLRAKLPLKLYGQGWETLEEFKSYASGAVESREQFQQIIANSAALVHAWPGTQSHPIDAINKPVVRRRGRNSEAFIRDAQAALGGKVATTSTASSTLQLSLLQAILRTLNA